MKKVVSISGGRTSAYVAANYPSDELLFALVRIEDERCRFPDREVAKQVEDRIQKPFIATAEDDKIIYTMLDLEQFLGRKINWVSGETYEQVIKIAGGFLPNKTNRFCTTELKIKPMFEWWQRTHKAPIEMLIGYRANEVSRANTMNEKLNPDGLSLFLGVVGRTKTGRGNKWADVPWQHPVFPLIEDGILKSHIASYWKDKPVRFAMYNNCVGCFHRNPVFLRFMWDEHPGKMQWFADQEVDGHWRTDVPYEKAKRMMAQTTLYPEDFGECDSGHCEIE